MTASTTAAGTAPRFDPQVARRKLSGTIFLGACMAAHRNPAHRLDRTPCRCRDEGRAVARPRLPDRRPLPPCGLGRHPAGPRRLARDRLPDRADLVPDRRGCRDLPRGVRPRHVRHPDAPHEHRQPGRRAVDHLRHLRARDLRPGDGPREVAPRRRPDAGAAHHADRDHRHDRGAPGRARLAARRRLCPRRDSLADGPRVGPAGGGARHRDRGDPGNGPGDRRSGPDHRHRRRGLRHVPADPAPGGVQHRSDPGLPVGRPARRPTSRGSPPRPSSSCSS